MISFKEFLKEEVVDLKIPAKEEYKKIMNWKITSRDSEAELAELVHQFVMNKENPREDRKKVLAVLDNIIDDAAGITTPRDPVTDKDVDDYVAAGDK